MLHLELSLQIVEYLILEVGRVDTIDEHGDERAELGLADELVAARTTRRAQHVGAKRGQHGIHVLAIGALLVGADHLSDRLQVEHRQRVQIEALEHRLVLVVESVRGGGVVARGTRYARLLLVGVLDERALHERDEAVDVDLRVEEARRREVVQQVDELTHAHRLRVELELRCSRSIVVVVAVLMVMMERRLVDKEARVEYVQRLLERLVVQVAALQEAQLGGARYRRHDQRQHRIIVARVFRLL